MAAKRSQSLVTRVDCGHFATDILAVAVERVASAEAYGLNSPGTAKLPVRQAEIHF